MGRQGLTLVRTILAITIMIIGLLAVIASFTSGSPFAFFEEIARMGGEIPTSPGEGTPLYWNNLSVYGAEETGIAEEYKRIALLTFSQPLRDNILQGGYEPVEVLSPDGVSIASGHQGSQFGVQANQLAFTLSGDIPEGQTVEINITDPISSDEGTEVVDVTCTDTFEEASSGAVEASSCN